jgi:hypothetical protein
MQQLTAGTQRSQANGPGPIHQTAQHTQRNILIKTNNGNNKHSKTKSTSLIGNVSIEYGDSLVESLSISFQE